MKKRNQTTIILFYFLLSFKGTTQCLFYVKSDTIIPFYYAWGDEFEGNQVNPELWQTHYGWGNTIPHNGEQQFYTRGNNLKIKDGMLWITARRKDTIARCYDHMKDNDSIFFNGNFVGMNRRKFPFTSGLVQSRTLFRFGYFEIKFKLSSTQQGFWPAFWLYGGDPYEEIDWMEIKSELPKKISVNLHHKEQDSVRRKTIFGEKRFGGWIRMKKADFSRGMVVVSGLWNEKEISFFVNGYKSGTFRNVMNQEKLLVANMAVAQDNWAFPPGPKPDFHDSIHYIIDYIRVWKPLENNKKTTSLTGKTMTDNEIKIDNPSDGKYKPELSVYTKKKYLKDNSVIIKLLNYRNQLLVLREGNMQYTKKLKLEVLLKNKDKKEFFLDFKSPYMILPLEIKEITEICLWNNRRPCAVKIN